MRKNLTIKQEKFVLKYFECGNAAEAYKYAYDVSKMKKETIINAGYKLSNKGDIRARLQELQAKAEEESKWSVNKLIKAHTRTYEIAIGDRTSPHIVTEGVRNGVTNTIEVNVRDTNLAGATKALIEIGKLLGYYKDKVEVSGELDLKDFVKELHEEKKAKQQYKS